MIATYMVVRFFSTRLSPRNVQAACLEGGAFARPTPAIAAGGAVGLRPDTSRPTSGISPLKENPPSMNERTASLRERPPGALAPSRLAAALAALASALTSPSFRPARRSAHPNSMMRRRAKRSRSFVAALNAAPLRTRSRARVAPQDTAGHFRTGGLQVERLHQSLVRTASAQRKVEGPSRAVGRQPQMCPRPHRVQEKLIPGTVVHLAGSLRLDHEDDRFVLTEEGIVEAKALRPATEYSRRPAPGSDRSQPDGEGAESGCRAAHRLHS